MRRPLAVLLVAVVAAASFAADETPPAKQAARAVDPREVGVGELVPDLELTLADGAKRRLSQFAGKSGLVLVARSETCPVGRRYGPTLAALEKDAAALGFGIVHVDVAADASPADAATAAKAYAFTAPYAIDADRAAARALRLRSTTEVVLLDAARTLVYRGAVDDQYGVGFSREAPKARWLLDAMKSAAALGRPDVEATTAPGCALELGPTPAPAPAAVPTWHNRVSRIVDRNCVECHRAGDAGPFPLVTLADVRAQREMMRVVVADRTMPPWFAAPGHGPWTTDRSLSERDRADLLAWLDAKCPEGDAKDAAAPIARTAGWRIGTPDLVLETERTFDVPASGVLGYQYAWAPAAFPEDRWVRGFEVRASAPQVVHHVLVFARFRDKRKRQGPFDGGLTEFFAALVPGQGHLVWPDGIAKKLPAGTDLLFQIHYTPNGTAVRDRPRIGLLFAKEKPAHEVRTRGIFDVRFQIPPGAAHHPVHAAFTFPVAGRILEFMPHMHLRGSAFRYELELPEDATPKTILDVPRYDFDWQLVYRLREPIDVPRGTRLHATGWFDNSAKNAANPDPARTVEFGEQTSDEMMIGYVDWIPLGPEDAK